MKHKKIMIILVIVAILVATGAIGVLYVKTDLFKTNEQLFFKYLFKTKLIDDEITKKYETVIQNINSSNYSSNGNINCSIAVNNNTTNIANIQNLFSIKYNTLQNKTLNQSYADFAVASDNRDMITFRYLKDNNIYALKSDSIINKYLAVQNSNLRELATKLEIENAQELPDSIPQMSLKEFFKVDDEILKNMISTYSKVLTNKLESNNFSRTTNSDGTKSIELSLTQQEVANIIKAILETIKNDETTLNLIIEKASLLQYELNIDSLKTSIQEQIDEITNTNYSIDADFIKITITENGKETVKVEFQAMIKNTANDKQTEKIEKQYYCSIDLMERDKRTIIIKDNEGNNIKQDITFSYNESAITANIDLFHLDENNQIKNNVGKIQYQINHYADDEVNQNIVVALSTEDNNIIQISIDNIIRLKQDIQIEKITNENALLLNNLSKEDLNNLLERIISRIQYLYGGMY